MVGTYEKSVHDNGNVQLLVDQYTSSDGSGPRLTVYVTVGKNLVYPGRVGAPEFDNKVIHSPPAAEHLSLSDSEFERLKNTIGGTWSKEVLPS